MHFIFAIFQVKSKSLQLHVQCISQNFDRRFAKFIVNPISLLRTWEFHYVTGNQMANFQTNLGISCQTLWECGKLILPLVLVVVLKGVPRKDNSKCSAKNYWKLQSLPKVVGTLGLYHISPFPPNQCWKISRFFHQKGKNHPIINIESGGRGELASCLNSFVWDCLKEEFKELHTTPSN